MLELSFFPIGACNVMLRQFKAAASIAPQSHVVIRKIGVSTGTALGAHEVACRASEGLDGCRLGFGVKICWSHRSNILWSDIEKGGEDTKPIFFLQTLWLWLWLLLVLLLLLLTPNCWLYLMGLIYQ
jgi:hypothetical protein